MIVPGGRDPWELAGAGGDAPWNNEIGGKVGESLGGAIPGDGGGGALCGGGLGVKLPNKYTIKNKHFIKPPESYIHAMQSYDIQYAI